MASRRLLKLILAGIFVSGATLCWNLQRDFPKDPVELVIHRASKALALPLQDDNRRTETVEGRRSQGETSGSSGDGISRSPLVALVSCQDRASLTMVTIKSALMVSHRPLRFIIFADRENAKDLNTQISRFPRRIRARANFSILPVEFPASARESQAMRVAHKNGNLNAQTVPDVGSDWRQLFKPCSAQRLFLPDLLKSEDAVLYVDTDTVFLRPVEQLWELFDKMNESQIAAAAAESEDENSGWYPRLARHPYVHPRGVNSGVMLLNLTRLRAFDWAQRVASVYEQWREHVVWGDQDIINIVFSNHSDAVYILPCEWNFRPDHCQYSSPCRGANRQGPGLLHGSRAVFTNNKQPAFRAIFKAFQQFTFRKKSRKLRHKSIQRSTKQNLATDDVRVPIGKYIQTGQRSVNMPLPIRITNSVNGEINRRDAKNQLQSNTMNAHAGLRAYIGKAAKSDKEMSASVDYGDGPADENVIRDERNGNTQLKMRKDHLREKQGAAVEDDDEDDELSLKERLISPLTIGIFETVNTRCGRFLKAHTKRLTRALYARAGDL